MVFAYFRLPENQQKQCLGQPMGLWPNQRPWGNQLDKEEAGKEETEGYILNNKGALGDSTTNTLWKVSGC